MGLQTLTEFLIFRDGDPYKVKALDPGVAPGFLNVLERRYPDHDWAIAYRFQPEGTD